MEQRWLRWLPCLAWVAALPMPAAAQEFAPFSFSVNLIASAMNQDNNAVGRNEEIDDGAYTINFAYARKIDPQMGDTLGVRHEYYGLRLFKWKGVYVSRDQSFGTSGVFSVSGASAVYGRRYFVDRARFEGLGLGLFAGLASIRQQSTEFPLRIEEKSYVSPVAGSELFYRVDVWRNVFVEPVASVAYLKTRSGAFNTHLAFNLGARF